MDKFVSISVNQGDAFYLERDDIKILVDGGKAQLGFPVQFERTIGKTDVDIVVCTHADADHINGLIGFFDSGMKTKELWLPGKWTSRLKDLLERPFEFGLEVFKLIEKLDNRNNIDLEDIYEVESIYDSNIDHKEDGGDLETLNIVIENISKKSSFDKPLDCFLYYPYEFLNLNHIGRNLFLDAIDTAKKIRELSITAYHSGAKIRWFEYSKSSSASGGEPYLLPVNSQEILKISKYMNALAYLSVSKANQESLVFYSPSSNHKTDVLFSGDSDFSFLQKFPSICPTSIITSPHHGSEHNKKAYERLVADDILTEKTILVRSDGKFKTRPGNTYKSVKAKKVCTLCRHDDSERQNVIFSSSSNGWRKKKGLHWCYCV